MNPSNENNNTLIGAYVLETLTTGMYRNPLDALREYVQNAFDSIRKAEGEGFIQKGAGRIHIHVDEKEKTLAVRDNGLGVAREAIRAKLVNIGMSAKDLRSDAGFRGIGRLAGIAYCDTLVFKTQYFGEQEVCTVAFDARSLRESMLPKNREVEELSKVIDRHVSVTAEKSRKNENFLEVSMQCINPNGNTFLNAKTVRDYLEQVAPLPIDTQSFAWSKEFYNWIDKTGVYLPEVRIIIESSGNSYELFKPYKKITYSTAQGKHKVHINSLRFWPEDASKDSRFWLWYAETNCPGIIGNDSVAGLRLRKSNIGIGLSERMTDIFRLASESYARFNRYFMGEVHIQDPSVIPNAHRDDFEETQEWLSIREQLVQFAKERSREAYALSEGRNADVEKLFSAADKQLDEVERKKETGLASKTEKERLCDKIGKQIAKLESAEKADRPAEERERIAEKRDKLSTALEEISNNVEFTGQTLKSSLDKKQRKIVSEILSLLYDALDETNFEKARNAILKKYQIEQNN